jgi:hypothetical protein
MNATLAEAILDNDVTRLAVAVGATEAVAFRYVRTPDNQRDLELLHHIRPGNATAEQRADAVSAFRKLIAKCAHEMKDGVFAVEHTPRPRYCLVVGVFRGWALHGYLAFITPCEDDTDARAKLRRLQEFRPRMETP